MQDDEDTIQESNTVEFNQHASVSEANYQPEPAEEDEILNHTFSITSPPTFSSDSTTGPLSEDQLDQLILQLRTVYT